MDENILSWGERPENLVNPLSRTKWLLSRVMKFMEAHNNITRKLIYQNYIAFCWL